MSYHNNPPAGQPAHVQLIEPLSALPDDAPPADTAAPDPTEPEAVAAEAHAAGVLDADAVERIRVKQAEGSDAAWRALTDALKSADAGNKALDAIARLFQPGDVVELRALNPAAGGAVSLCGRLNVPDEREALADFINRHNGLWNVYFGANPRIDKLAGTQAHANTRHVKLRRSFFLDLDDKDAPERDKGWTRTVGALVASDNPPDMIVRTGNGVHVWWRVQELTGEALAETVLPLQTLMARFGSDNVADLPRIARLPLTVNLPTASKRKRGAVPAFVRLEHVRHWGREGCAELGAPLLTLDAIVERLSLLSELLALPGNAKQGGAKQGKSQSRSATGSDGARSPRPAPSLGLLRMALEELPNEPGGPFDHYDDWVQVGHDVKGAVQGTDFEAEGREAFLTWSALNEGDANRDARLWDSVHQPRNGWGTLMGRLRSVNPQGHARVRQAELKLEREASLAELIAAPIDATEVARLLEGNGTGGRGNGAMRIEPRGAQVLPSTAIPPRQWLYDTTYIRGHFSLTVAPGGVGKSSLVLVEALSMVTLKALLPGAKLPPRPLRVWMLNLEDPQDELDRRLAAACAHFGLTAADLAGRLMMNSGRNMPLRLVDVARSGGVEVNEPAVMALIKAIRRKQIDVLILDPLAILHGAPENDNTAMNIVAAVLRRVADETGTSVMAVHHTTKAAALASGEQGIYGARGAGAIIDAARVARFLVRMTANDAKRFHVDDALRRSLFRVENGKANLGPPENAQWRRIVSVALKNGTRDYPQGDRVGVAEAWEPPAAQGTSVTNADITRIQLALQVASLDERRESAQAHGWVGYLIARVLGLGVGQPSDKRDDLDPHCSIERDRVKSLIATGLAEGWLVKNMERCGDRQDRPCIRAGKPVEPLEEPAVEIWEETA